MDNIKDRARRFINSEEIKETLDAVTRMWIEEHIIDLLEEAAKDSSCGNNAWMEFHDPLPAEEELILVNEINRPADHPHTMFFGKSYLNSPNIKNCRWAKIPPTK